MDISMLAKLKFKKILEPTVARRWRSMTRAQLKITAEAREDMVQSVHERLRNVVIVAGWPIERRIEVPISLSDAISTIVDLTLRINTALGQEITSMDIHPIGVRPETKFDPAVMDNTFASSRKSVATNTGDGSLVVGTTDVGLQMAPIEGENGKIYSRIFLKPKVVLESAFKNVVH